MRRLIIAVASTVAGLGLLFAYPTSLNRSALAEPLGSSARSPATPLPQPASSAGAGSGSPAATSATYDGASVQTRYGPVQVRITVVAGKVTGADAIQLPSGNSYDDQVRQFAVPTLNQEAVAAQSAKIAMVSGATFTSSAYKESLQSALDQAKL